MGQDSRTAESSLQPWRLSWEYKVASCWKLSRSRFSGHRRGVSVSSLFWRDGEKCHRRNFESGDVSMASRCPSTPSSWWALFSPSWPHIFLYMRLSSIPCRHNSVKSYNSCVPGGLAVSCEFLPLHVPRPHPCHAQRLPPAPPRYKWGHIWAALCKVPTLFDSHLTIMHYARCQPPFNYLSLLWWTDRSAL